MAKGRRSVLVKNHPFLPDGRMARYRFVMAEKLGRPLQSWEDVHHKDEDTTNDDPDNLELKTRKEHNRHHKSGKPRPQEVRDKISAGHLGKKRPPEFGRTMSAALKGRKLSADHVAAIKRGLTGRKLSADHIEAIRRARTSRR